MIRALPTQQEFLTYSQLAERMHCSEQTIRRMKAEGMPYVVWGRRLVRFSAVEAIRWASERKRAA